MNEKTSGLINLFMVKSMRFYSFAQNDIINEALSGFVILSLQKAGEESF